MERVSLEKTDFWPPFVGLQNFKEKTDRNSFRNIREAMDDCDSIEGLGERLSKSHKYPYAEAVLVTAIHGAYLASLVAVSYGTIYFFSN